MKIARLFEFIDHQAAAYPKQDTLAAKVNGVWKKYSTSDFIQTSQHFAIGLLEAGLKPGDKVAMISANRPEWNFADIGMQQVGIINVPIYTTLSEAEIKFILNDCGARIVLAGDAQLFQKIEAVRGDVPGIIGVYTFDRVEGATNWSEIVSKGQAAFDASRLAECRDAVKPGDCATILYTSGTTGTPKGVMLSHHNIVSNVLAVEHLPPVDHHDTALSFLPLCHSYERVLTYLYQYLGVSVYYAESMDKIADNIREIHPQVFSAVPRLLEKVYDRIVDKGKELTGLKRKLFFWALELGLRYELDGKNGAWYEFQLKLARKIIFSKWREALGGNTRCIVSGGAALQPRLARVFWAAGIPVLEGYGLTETSPIIAVNNFEPQGTCFSTVGPVIAGVTVRIAADGEILCKGPNIMMGYYNRPDLTNEVIDAEGWFHTGDIGTLVDGRFLKITDRKKEIFKTSGGKYIAPQAVENKLKESAFIEQVMVVGENKKFPGALIVPAFQHLRKWCAEEGIQYTTDDKMITDARVVAKIDDEIKVFNQDFGQAEQVKKFELVKKEWTIDGGELTATLKLRRKFIMERYQDLINRIYEEQPVAA